MQMPHQNWQYDITKNASRNENSNTTKNNGLFYSEPLGLETCEYALQRHKDMLVSGYLSK